MGAGQGKNRRTGTTMSLLAAKPNFVESSWDEFVEKHDLQETSLYEYYLDKNSGVEAEDVITARIMNELLGDAVAVGALTLPPPYTASDFDFKITSGSPYGWANRAAKVVLKATPEVSRSSHTFPVVLTDGIEMDHKYNYVRIFFGETVLGIEQLLKAKARREAKASR